MIVPGHEADFGGTEHGSLKEREMNVDLAKELQFFLQNNPRYEVILARDKNGWNADLQKYFNDNWDEIKSFVKTSKSEMVELIKEGTVKKLTDGVIHNTAPQNVALRLYGINKWNNENKVDLAIHVHFNNYTRSNENVPGEYNGFAIYIPEKQFSNSTTTKAIASTVFNRLAKYNPVSNLPKEKMGLVEGQDLIAIGSYNTVDAPSMLIEYGYIYEPQFATADIREISIRDMAFQTYLGIQDFFEPNNSSSLAYDTVMLPYQWKTEINKNVGNKNEILALQTLLMSEGLYPPENKTKNECPRTGTIGGCTLKAISSFQNKYGIKDEVNKVGKQTIEKLNSLNPITIK